MTRRIRLDAELVRRGLAQSRQQAATLVSAGRVRVAGRVAVKPASGVSTDTAIVVVEDSAPEYASRGGHKLAGALEVFRPGGLAVAGRRCLDAGASTGGFTDVLLRSGAREVVAVDVGYGQLAWPLRTDSRVTVLDRTNVRDLTADLVGGPVDLVVADLSFISLTLVLGALVGVTAAAGDLVVLVKPQFEVGREHVGRGVVRDAGLRTEAVARVAAAAVSHGWGGRALATSPLPGPSGNVEYFLWLGEGPAQLEYDDIAAEVRRSTALSGGDEKVEP